jgi:hypothetical protein
MSQLSKFYVWGEYGPIASQSISRRYLAVSAQSAKQMFIERMKRDESHLWERMGPSNVHVESGWRE